MPRQKPPTESEFSKQVVEVAHEYEWMVAHFHTSRAPRNGAWLTAASVDGKGFPDMVLARERIIFAELKTGTNVLRPEQRMWLEELNRAGCESYVWYPRDLEEIRMILSLRIPPEKLARLVHASGGDVLQARRVAIDTALTKMKSGPKAALVSTHTAPQREVRNRSPR